MALGDSYRDDLLTAIADRAATPAAPSVPKFSAWSAIPRGIGEAGAQVAGTAADLAASWRYLRDATPEQRKQIDRQGVPVEQFSSASGDAARDFGKSFRSDPETASTAEQVLYGFARGASKIVAGAVAGGVPGILAAGVEEGITQSDELRRQGVDLKTRSTVGLVQGAGLALAALPAAGATLKSTAALYMAGGPGGFVAQQALTREILRNAGQDKLAEQYDPFDPVGLAVSSLIPLPFAFYGLRGAKKAAAAKAAEDFRTGAIPSEPTAVAGAVRDAYSPEVVDAAMVLHSQERRAASSVSRADDAPTAAAHETALTKAEDQIARGEPVQVADVAPTPRVPPTETPEFKDWFGGSRTVAPDGAPMVLYHGTGADFVAFESNPRGIFFAEDPASAEPFTRIRRDAAPNILPVYVSIKNPWTMVKYGDDVPYSQMIDQSVEALKAKGYDGTHDPERGVWVAFAPEQIKSAIGNSGRFDPTSASLTDPLQNFADALDQVRRAATQEPARAEGTADAGARSEVMPAVESFDSFAARELAAEAAPKAAKQGPDLFISWLKSRGGVNFAEKADITGEAGGVRRNIGSVFKKSGQPVDLLHQSAMDEGWLPAGSDSRDLREMIRRAMNGERLTPMDHTGNFDAMREAAMQGERLQFVEARMRLLGVDPAPARGDAGVMERYLAEHEDRLLRRTIDEVVDETHAGAERIASDFGLTPDQVDMPAKIALAMQIDESAVERASMRSNSDLDFLDQIDEILRHAPRRSEADAGSGSTQADARMGGRDGEAPRAQAGADTGTQAAGLTPADKAEGAAVLSRLAEVQAQHPGLQVMLDGMDKPMPLADFLAAVKAEADEMVADAPLMQVAATCALQFGV